MRYHEIASGLWLPASGEESELLDRAGGAGLAESGLDERDLELARKLRSRGLLDRVRDRAGRARFRASTVKDIWRNHDDR